LTHNLVFVEMAADAEVLLAHHLAEFDDVTQSEADVVPLPAHHKSLSPRCRTAHSPPLNQVKTLNFFRSVLDSTIDHDLTEHDENGGGSYDSNNTSISESSNSVCGVGDTQQNLLTQENSIFGLEKWDMIRGRVHGLIFHATNESIRAAALALLRSSLTCTCTSSDWGGRDELSRLLALPYLEIALVRNLESLSKEQEEEEVEKGFRASPPTAMVQAS